MTRINTNVSSLLAQKTLGRSNVDLQTSLTRLSTGLRINSGKDDPAGLIASENLRRDITSINKAITNTERANQLIATGDSALSQISNLLNDIRGLVVEAANTGVLSSEQIAANQLQVDSSLEALDRIAQVTTFQGRKLLDGSLDFQVAYTAGGATVLDLNIDQANLGTAGSVDVDITISTAATQAIISNTSFGTPAAAQQADGSVTLTNGSFDIAAVAGGAADGIIGNTTDLILQASAGIAQSAGTSALAASGGTIVITADATGTANGAAGDSTTVVYQAATDIAQAGGTITLTATADTIDIDAVAGGAADGAAGNVTVVIAEGTGATAATYDANTNTITVNVDDSIVGGDTTANIAAAIANIGGGGVFTASAAGGAAQYDDTDDNSYAGDITGGSDGTTGAVYAGNTITVDVALGADLTAVAAAINSLADFNATPTNGGNAFDTADFAVSTTFTGGSDGTTTAAYNAGTNAITVNVALNGTIGDVAAAVGNLADFNTSNVVAGAVATADFATTNPLTGGVNAVTGGLAADLVVKITGSIGAEVFTFEAGATLTQIVNAVNLVSDATGVQATNNAGVLELESTGYGSNAIVDVEVLSEGTGGGFEAALDATRDSGADIVATVNGVTANGSGNRLSINTTTLDLSLTVSDGSSTAISFSIDGGGAVFQLGPQVVSNQQARIGIGSVSTGELGGVDGRLYQLRSGNDSDLATDPNRATLIVDSAINKVTSLRGRLGAFQRTTLETNIASLADTVTNLVEAESSIRDADFAAESARLTRAQILVQSGTQVLAIANQNPQNVLALLRG